MEPITIITIIATALISTSVIVLVWLYWDEIVNWFRDRRAIKKADKANIAFTIKQDLAAGNYKLIQGIFNTQTEEIVDSRVIEAKNLDNKLAEAHRGNELVIYD